VLLLGCMVWICSCTEAEQYKLMTFFFDGVPPLSGTGSAGSGPDETTAGRLRRPELHWILHEPQADCPRCHGDQRQRSFSRQVRLTAPVPTLCYECHARLTPQDGWIHGPVAAGECTLCHEPHRSLNEYLLKKPVPDLCFQCHVEATVRRIENHDKPTYATCLDCHDGHASASRYLLKIGPTDGWARSQQSMPTGFLVFDDLLADARRAIRALGQPDRAFQTAADLIRRGDLTAARAYLLAMRMELPLSETHRDTLRELEKQITEAEAAQAADQRRRRHEQARAMAELYYRSMLAYRDGGYETARAGFVEVMESDVVPEPIKTAIKGYIEQIDRILSGSYDRDSDIRP